MDTPSLEVPEWEALRVIATRAVPVERIDARIRRTLEERELVRIDEWLIVPTYKGMACVADRYPVAPVPKMKGPRTAVLERIARCPEGVVIHGTRIQSSTLVGLEKRQCISVRWLVPQAWASKAWLAVAGFVAVRSRLGLDELASNPAAAPPVESDGMEAAPIAEEGPEREEAAALSEH
jgi:hypothetical protein